jgi:hypothetical protein
MGISMKTDKQKANHWTKVRAERTFVRPFGLTVGDSSYAPDKLSNVLVSKSLYLKKFYENWYHFWVIQGAFRKTG